MRSLVGKHGNKHMYSWLLVVLLGIAGLMPSIAMAQEATATVNGTVKDQTGAAIPNAQVALRNADTGVVRTTSTNGDGVHDFPSITPGSYSMQASARGFSSVSQPPVTLQVNQIATFDFQLNVGTEQSTVTVNATAAALQSTSAELGTVVAPNQMNDLPLNGRNFTQLLTITPGVANINTDQNSGGGGGWNGESIGQFSFPAVNGARNRSNLFLLDGANDLNSLAGTYNYGPIIDDIQEFKTDAHNDLAEYGAAAGAVVTVVSKSGTNQFHGTLWEFLRNQVFDSTGYFNHSNPPLRQNQYGAAGGGPITIPKLYNGKNRTFFYASWEDYKFRSAQETGVLGPTAAEAAGDFSALGVPIYDPTTTTYDASTNTYSRKTFTEEYNEGPTNTALCNGDINCIPQSAFNKISSLYTALLPATGALINGENYYASARTANNQQSGTMRFDQNFGNNNQVMFRYSQFDLTEAGSASLVGLSTVHVPGHNYIGHWYHTFSPTSFSDAYFGRNWGYTFTGTTWPAETSSFLSSLKSAGMSPAWMTLDNQDFAPQFTAQGYSETFSGSQLQLSTLADDWQWGGSFTKIVGRHTLKAGADFQSNNLNSPIAYAGVDFAASQTAGLGAEQGVGGNSWASLLIGVPNDASYRNIYEFVHGGWIDGVYIQDQWKLTPHLTLNLGFRNDFVLVPIYGTMKGGAGDFYTGNANPLTGEYELNALPPTCSATQGAPCIPAGSYTASSTPAPGGLPPHAYVNPNSNHQVVGNSMFNWGARAGFAYRLNDRTLIRGGYTRVYDAWATILQLSQNFGGNWPAVNTLDNNNLNTNVPTASVADPLGLGGGGALTYPINDFSQVSQWMVDPNFKTPYYDQWNVGVERALPGNIALDANYVGSKGSRGDWGPELNTPQPGPGNPQANRPYPYMLGQWFDQSVGKSTYNALQVSATQRPTHGITFLVSYTLAHSNADGCNLGASCDSTNPYNKSGDYGNSDLNQRNVFSAAFTAKSPYDKAPNKLLANVAGGWSLNGIVQVTSGKPYTVTTGEDTENISSGGLQERMSYSGNANGGSGTHTQSQWFNINDFTLPAPYTYGAEKTNPLVSQHFNDVDLSIFRDFHMGLGEERYFEFRAESFNLFNNVVFNTPNTSFSGLGLLNPPPAGTTPTPPYVTNPATNQFGNVTSQWNAPRVLQFSLKLYF
jgi:hypothetical protein